MKTLSLSASSNKENATLISHENVNTICGISNTMFVECHSNEKQAVRNCHAIVQTLSENVTINQKSCY